MFSLFDYIFRERFIGQRFRSRGKNGNQDIPLTSESIVDGPAKEETQEYDVRCFQSIFFFAQ